MMYTVNIKETIKQNDDYRHVLFTGSHCQIVAMKLVPGEEIGEEIHADADQIFVFLGGEGQAIVEGEQTNLYEHGLLVVPAGAKHNIRNTGDEDLKFYTVYSPPAHQDGLVQKTKN